MRNIAYSAAKSDLLTPWQRGNYFSNGEAQHTASLCAELSRLAYCRKAPGLAFDNDTIRSVLTNLGFSRVGFFESRNMDTKGIHCFTALGPDPDSENQIGMVVFRGTDADDPTDIGDDADFILEDWECGGKVHAGFAKALEEVRPGLTNAVQAMSPPILFTGHSLGAALATLAASLYKGTGKVAALYTYGSPRVGNSAFADTMAKIESYRFRDCSDVVTRVPLSEMGYAHVGPARYIDRNGLITINPSERVVDEDHVAAECDYLLKYAWKPENIGVRDLADHAPINYVWAVTT
jgi:hypothetical protein